MRILCASMCRNRARYGMTEAGVSGRRSSAGREGGRAS